MDDLWTLVPVKRLDKAKARLADVLEPDARRALARALAERTLSIVAASDLAHVAVVTSDPEVACLARAVGLPVLPDRGHDHSSAVRLAVTAAVRAGAAGIVTVAADLPLLAPADLAALHGLVGPGTLVIAPDRAGTGTNAVAVASPVFPFSFGPSSFRRHVAAAHVLGLTVRVLRTRGLVADVDEAKDLALVESWRP